MHISIKINACIHNMLTIYVKGMKSLYEFHELYEEFN